MIIPPGWTAVPIEDVLATLPSGRKIDQGWSPQCDKESAASDEWGVLKTTAVQPGAFVDTHHKRLPAHMSPRPGIEVRPGDLVLTNAGPRARCAIPCLVRRTRDRLMLSGKMYRFRPDIRLMDPRYLELLLLAPSSQRVLDRMKTGISDSGLNLTQARFLALPIVMPPLREQRRIVDILEDHLSRLDAADALTVVAEAKLDAWRRACIDRLVWGSRATRVPLSSLLREPMRNGHSARATRDGSGIRTLSLTAVTRGHFSEQFTKMTTANAQKVAGLWLRSGDILVERSNTPELVGTAALYDGPDNWAVYPDLVIRVRVDPSRALPGYVAGAVRSERAHRWLRSRAKGLAGSMPKIDQGTIGALELPISSLDEQAAVAAQVDGVEINRDRLLRESQAARRRAAALRRSLLQSAFSGRLTGASTDIEIVEELAGV